MSCANVVHIYIFVNKRIFRCLRRVYSHCSMSFRFFFLFHFFFTFSPHTQPRTRIQSIRGVQSNLVTGLYSLSPVDGKFGQCLGRLKTSVIYGGWREAISGVITGPSLQNSQLAIPRLRQEGRVRVYYLL